MEFYFWTYCVIVCVLRKILFNEPSVFIIINRWLNNKNLNSLNDTLKIFFFYKAEFKFTLFQNGRKIAVFLKVFLKQSINQPPDYYYSFIHLFIYSFIHLFVYLLLIFPTISMNSCTKPSDESISEKWCAIWTCFGGVLTNFNSG